MTDKLKQIVKEEIAKLPTTNQEAINGINWAAVSEGVCKRNSLSESETNDLQVQTLLVLIGLESLDDFAGNVEDEVGTSKDEADRIATEITDRIFVPIADIGIENIKKNIKTKTPGWEQSVDFILSGGDYSAFMEQRKKLDAEDTEKPVIPVFPIKS